MKKIDILEFNELIKRSADIKPKLKRDIRFNNSVVGLDDEEWESSEMIPIFDKSKNHGILLADFDGSKIYLLPFDLFTRVPNSTGRVVSIICDFCRTWRPGVESASITFSKDKRMLNSVTFLCCGDLKCSMNARNKTDAAIKSRTQVREDISVEGKIIRLQNKLLEVIKDLKLEELK